MDPIQVPIGPITKAWAKKFKENLNAFILRILDEESSWSSKGKDKSVDPAWVTVVRALEWEDWNLGFLTNSVDYLMKLKFGRPLGQPKTPIVRTSIFSYFVPRWLQFVFFRLYCFLISIFWYFEACYSFLKALEM